MGGEPVMKRLCYYNRKLRDLPAAERDLVYWASEEAYGVGWQTRGFVNRLGITTKGDVRSVDNDMMELLGLHHTTLWCNYTPQIRHPRYMVGMELKKEGERSSGENGKVVPWETITGKELFKKLYMSWDWSLYYGTPMIFLCPPNSWDLDALVKRVTLWYPDNSTGTPDSDESQVPREYLHEVLRDICDKHFDRYNHLESRPQ